jgi:hypothetical protein
MFQNTDEFKQLVSLYAAEDTDDAIGLYLGAGINLPTREVKNPFFDTYSWSELLHAIYNRNMSQYSISFERLKNRYANNWPGLAEALVGEMSVEKLVDEIDLIIYHCLPRKDDDSRLSLRMLRQAPTLHATICFATRIKEPWTFERNPKIATVITPNYDFFFGAGWTNYQAFSEQWKVMTPFSTGEADPAQRTINYIHGYIPYNLNRKKELVLTRESYKSAYKKGGFARRVLEHAVREYHLIFVGTSFGDKPVNRILGDAMRKNDGKQHFSIEKSPAPEKLAFLEELGIIPIIVEDYAEIANVLKVLYSAGLEKSDWDKFNLEKEAYWARLKKGPDK